MPQLHLADPRSAKTPLDDLRLLRVAGRARLPCAMSKGQSRTDHPSPSGTLRQETKITRRVFYPDEHRGEEAS
jgi:hypothetical protein